MHVPVSIVIIDAFHVDVGVCERVLVLGWQEFHVAVVPVRGSGDGTAGAARWRRDGLARDLVDI